MVLVFREWEHLCEICDYLEQLFSFLTSSLAAASLEVSSCLSSSSCCMRSIFCSSRAARSLSNCCSSSCGRRRGKQQQQSLKVLSPETDPEFPPSLLNWPLRSRQPSAQIPKKHFARFRYPCQPWSGVTTTQPIMLMNEEWLLLQHTIIAASQGQLELRKTAATLDEICCHYSLHRTAELVMS